MFQKDMKVSLLLDFYGLVLSERRRAMVTMYYDEDLSLAEIAEETGISRQGVRDSICKSVRELEELEEKLGLAARFEAVRKESAEIASLLEAAISKDSEEKDNILRECASRLSGIDF